MDLDKYLYYIWLHGISGIGPVTIKLLLNKFKTPEAIYNANLTELYQVEGVRKECKIKLSMDRNLEKSKKIIEACYKKEIKITAMGDEAFPSMITGYKDTPSLLYYKGILTSNLSGIVIVGARNCTEYSKNATIEASEYITTNGLYIISGMAKGIDSYAHTTSLKNSGYTVAVLGYSLDCCYPREHKGLMEEIIETGAVISEYPPGMRIRPEYFNKRNRIIAALADKVLIMEAGEKGGALLTAQYAQKYNKEVYVLPGEINSAAFIGSNKLISDGAKIYLSPQQLLNQELVTVKSISSKSVVESTLLKLLSNKPMTTDMISNKLGLDIDNITELLFMLEMDNKVRNISGGWRSK